MTGDIFAYLWSSSRPSATKPAEGNFAPYTSINLKTAGSSFQLERGNGGAMTSKQSFDGGRRPVTAAQPDDFRRRPPIQ
jgi:hypothetical protein